MVVLELDLVIYTALVAFVLGSLDGKLARTLSRPALVYVGQISYGLYLFHLPVLFLVQHVVSGPSGAAAALITTVALAVASWHLFELPIIA